MHFKRIFFQKGRKNVKSVWSSVHYDKVLLGCKRLAIVRQQWLICTAKESPKPYV